MIYMYRVPTLFVYAEKMRMLRDEAIAEQEGHHSDNTQMDSYNYIELSSIPYY